MKPSSWLKRLLKHLALEHNIWMESSVKLSESKLANNQNAADPRAFCYVVMGRSTIHYAAALEALPDKFIVGILLHELGHVMQGNKNTRKASNTDAEVDCDELILSKFPEAGYHYSDIRYRFKGKTRMARNLECVMEKFLGELT